MLKCKSFRTVNDRTKQNNYIATKCEWAADKCASVCLESTGLSLYDKSSVLCQTRVLEDKTSSLDHIIFIQKFSSIIFGNGFLIQSFSKFSMSTCLFH